MESFKNNHKSIVSSVSSFVQQNVLPTQTSLYALNQSFPTKYDSQIKILETVTVLEHTSPLDQEYSLKIRIDFQFLARKHCQKYF